MDSVTKAKLEILGDWFASKQDTLDEVIASTAEEYLEKVGNDKEGLKVALKELLNAGSDKDIDYSHEHIGLAYSLWYHPRRFNMLCGLLAEHLIKYPHHKTRKMNVIDLGGGTGPLPWAFQLLCKGIEELELRSEPFPPIVITYTDKSKPMIEYIRLLLSNLSEADLVLPKIKYLLRGNSWQDMVRNAEPASWVVASYLFDYLNDEQIEEATSYFANLMPKRPHKLLLMTSSKKSDVIVKVSEVYEKDEGYFRQNYSNHPNNNILEYPVFLRGELTRVNEVRDKLRQDVSADWPTVKTEWYREVDTYAWVKILTIWNYAIKSS